MSESAGARIAIVAEARLLVPEQLTSILHALPTLTPSERAGLAMALNVARAGCSGHCPLISSGACTRS